jgi:hypothetical protein
MLRNIAALVTLGLVALSHVSAIPVPGGDDNYRPDRYEHDYKPQCKGGQIFDKQLHKCLCPDSLIWEDDKCECVCAEG